MNGNVPYSNQDAQSGTAYASGTTATYTVQTAMTRGNSYCWQVEAIDPGGRNTWSSPSTPAILSINGPPSAPTLQTPSNNATGVAQVPQFWLATTDPDGDYVDYAIQLCASTDPTCASPIATVCQVAYTGCTASQTGWSNQNANSGTAYTTDTSSAANSKQAVYTWQGTALSASTTYYWRAYAIDPGATNTWGTASGIGSFVTGQYQGVGTPNPPPAHSVQIHGNVNVGGNVTIHP